MSRWVIAFLSAAWISNVGTWMQFVAQGWLVADLTPEPFWNGFVGFCNGIPMLFFSLVGGVYADRVNRRKMLIVTQIALMLVAVALGFLTFRGHIAIWLVAGLAALGGIATAFNNPAYFGFLFDITGGSSLKRAVSLNATQIHLSRMLGPGLAGMLLIKIGAAGCFLINFFSFLPLLPVAILVPRTSRQNLDGARDLSFWRSAGEAVAYAWRDRPIRQTLTMTALLAVCVMQHLSLLALYVKRDLQLGPEALGNLWVASALGSMLVTGFCIKHPFSSIDDGFRRIFVGAIGSALALLVFAWVRNLAAAYVTIFWMGAAIGLLSVSVQTQIQTLVSPTMRGRVLGLWGTLFQGLFPVGSIVVGAVAQVTSISVAWTIAATGLFLATLALGRRTKNPN